MRQHRPVPGTVKALQLEREHRRWYVVVISEMEASPPASAGRQVGVDAGVARFLTTSDGGVVANPRFLAAWAGVIADPERGKVHAKPGSGRPGSFPPNHAGAQAGLNALIPDADWARFISILSREAAEAGRRVVLVNPAGTSIECHRPDHPQQEIVIGPEHGVLDADVTGVRNTAPRAGLGSGQAVAAA